mgnify:CR=1 FL=1
MNQALNGLPGRTVVTGAGGFLGRRLVATLRHRQQDVLAVGRSTGFDLLRDELPLAPGDHVIHLAAATGVPDSWKDPAGFHLVNGHGTVRVLDACRRAGATLTYVGAYIYGAPKTLPISESHPLDVNNPYAFSKWMGEQACGWYASTFNVGVTAIRLFNVYGAGQSDRFVVPRIVHQVLDPTVASVQLMDLTPRRDYLHADDAVEALLASRPSLGQSFRVFNVGSGVSSSLGDVLDAAFDAAGIRKPVESSGEVRPNEIPDVRADCTAIRTSTGWTARIPLRDGIAQMIRELRP